MLTVWGRRSEGGGQDARCQMWRTRLPQLLPPRVPRRRIEVCKGDYLSRPFKWRCSVSGYSHVPHRRAAAEQPPRSLTKPAGSSIRGTLPVRVPLPHKRFPALTATRRRARAAERERASRTRGHAARHPRDHRTSCAKRGQLRRAGDRRRDVQDDHPPHRDRCARPSVAPAYADAAQGRSSCC
jgi:hypothetical protein